LRFALFTKYNKNNEVEDEMGGACNTNGGRRGMHIGYWWGSQSKRDQCGRILLRWSLKKQDGAVWTGLVWLRIGTSVMR
jgi:hypothetical protein